MCSAFICTFKSQLVLRGALWLIILIAKTLICSSPHTSLWSLCKHLWDFVGKFWPRYAKHPTYSKVSRVHVKLWNDTSRYLFWSFEDGFQLSTWTFFAFASVRAKSSAQVYSKLIVNYESRSTSEVKLHRNNAFFRYVSIMGWTGWTAN